MNWRLPWSRHPVSAAEWFVYLQRNTVTPRVSGDFLKWLNSTPENEVSYEDREMVWALAAELRHSPGIEVLIDEAQILVDAGQPPAPAAARVRGRRQFMRWIAPVAACATLAAIAVLALYRYSRPIEMDYITAAGEQRTVSLADGSTILMNTATHILIRFTRSERSVEIDTGEALFIVAKDPHRPFEVGALKGVTTAVGTQFVVRLLKGRAEVSVLEGVVNVKAQGGGGSGLPVIAGQATDYSAAGDFSPIRPADAQRIEAWKARRILFDDTPLSDAIEEYNLYAKIPIVLKSTAVGDRRIHGVFRIGDEPAFIHALEQRLPLRAAQTGQAIELVDR